ncbi:MAG: cadherin repeat domain-containing protein, partial [Bacteroidota bacterium]
LLALFGLMILVLANCKEEEVPEPPVTINLDVADLTTTIAENPTAGTVIGNIPSNQTSGVLYEVLNSEPAGAINIDPLTGDVSVADESAFDFESRDEITATIQASVGTTSAFANVAITITDADDLLTLLTTSRAAYEAETSGWIQITKEEYDLLFDRLQSATKVGLTDDDYDRPGTILQTSEGQAHSNSIQMPLPSNEFFIAFKYHSKSVAITGVRPKVSNSSPTSGFTGRGPLPAHESGDNYFLRKGVTTAETSSASYLGLYTPGRIGWKENSNCERYFRFGNGSDLTNGQNGAQVLIQGLTTATKQWD